MCPGHLTSIIQGPGSLEDYRLSQTNPEAKDASSQECTF